MSKRLVDMTEEEKSVDREKHRRWRMANAEKVRERARRYYHDNLEKSRERGRRAYKKYYDKNREKIIEKNKYYRKDKIKSRAHSKAYYYRNRDTVVKRMKSYREASIRIAFDNRLFEIIRRQADEFSLTWQDLIEAFIADGLKKLMDQTEKP